MSEINEIKIHETTPPEPKDGGSGFEIEKTPELKNLSSEIAVIKDAINHNETIDAENLLKIKSSLDDLMVDVYGEKMTIREAKSIPDLKMNIEIWKEIKSGKYENEHKLTHITKEIAEELLKDKMDGMDTQLSIRTLTPEIAEILIKNEKGDLHLNQLTSISKETAEVLSRQKGILYLNGINSLSPEVMEILGKHVRDIELNGLTEISVEVAKKISEALCNTISLDGLKNIPNEIAELLSDFKGGLFLRGVEELSGELAHILSRRKRSIALGVSNISDEIAEIMSKFKAPWLFLRELADISDDSARNLAKFKGFIMARPDIKEKIKSYKQTE